MIGFIVGFFIGGFFGIVTMCIMFVAGHDAMYEDDEKLAQPKDHTTITNPE